MIVLDRIFCDLCNFYMGQLWNQTAIVSGRISAPSSHICHNCKPQGPQLFSEKKDGGLGV